MLLINGRFSGLEAPAGAPAGLLLVVMLDRLD